MKFIAASEILFLFIFFFFNSCSSIADKTKLPPVEFIRNVPDNFKIKDPERIEYENEDLIINLYSRDFKQGDAIYAECVCIPDKIDYITSKLHGRYYSLVKRPWGYRAVLPLDPDAITGETDFILIYKLGDIYKQAIIELNINKAGFKTSLKKMYFGKYSDETFLKKEENIRKIKLSEGLRKEAFAHANPDYLSATLSHPRDTHHITSDFWSKRVYKIYYIKNKRKRSKNSIKIHRGLDLRGDEGSPVYAMERGKIVLADELFYEGNMIIIDHGNRIFSYYLHLKDIIAKKGTMVESGQLIGRVGSTGRVTGPHLHVSFMIGGIQVDPMSLFCLPIRR